MEEYFKNALSNFAFDVASGGVIRHLAKQGYAVSQIMERLDFPVSYEKVQQMAWNHLVECGVLLLDEPKGAGFREKAYGRDKEINLIRLLSEKCMENGEETAYVSCDYGILRKKEPEHYMALMEILDNRQKDYIEGLPWNSKRVYHRMNQRMSEILYSLLRSGKYSGSCYFMKLGEKVSF